MPKFTPQDIRVLHSAQALEARMRTAVIRSKVQDLVDNARNLGIQVKAADPNTGRVQFIIEAQLESPGEGYESYERGSWQGSLLETPGNTPGTFNPSGQ